MKNKQKKSILLIFILVIVVTGIVLTGLIYQQKQKKEFLKVPHSDERILKNIPEDDKIFIEGNSSGYKIYFKGTGENFIGYNLGRYTKDLDESVSSSNYDIWNVNTASEYLFYEPISEFRKKEEIITTGEWDMAFREIDASDFSGGTLHGDEVLESFKIMIDGEDYTDKRYKGNATTIEAEVTSNVFRDNTMTDEPEQIATHFKKFIFDLNGLTVEQKVEFNEEIKIDLAYLGMLPVDKAMAHTAYVNDAKHDISSSDAVVERTLGKEVIIKNEDESIEMKMTVLDNDSPQEMKVMVVNTDHYNKIYSIFAENPYSTSSGEIWNQTTNYSLITHN